MNTGNITAMERKRYIKPLTEVVNIEVNRIICTSDNVPDDYWG